jgi:hypothetical protein
MEERKWKQSASRMMSSLATQTSKESEAVEASAAPTRTTEFDSATAESLKDFKAADGDKSGSAKAMVIDNDDVVVQAKSDEGVQSMLSTEVSPEDEESAHAVAKKLSRMVSDLVRSNATNGIFSQPPDVGQSDLTAATCQRELTASTKEEIPIDSLAGRVSVPPDTGQDLPATDSLAGESAKCPEGLSNGKRAIQKGDLLEKISKHINEMLSSVEREPSASEVTKQAPASPKTHGLSLSDSEKVAVGTIEDLWSRLHAGAVLRGSVASGKTITTCSLLWRKRLAGPQLVICSSASMVRVAWLSTWCSLLVA